MDIAGGGRIVNELKQIVKWRYWLLIRICWNLIISEGMC